MRSGFNLNFILAGIRKRLGSMAGKLFDACRWVVGVPIDVRNDIMKSQWLGSILLFRMVLVAPTVG